MFKLPTDAVAEANGCFVDPTIPEGIKKWCADNLPHRLLDWQAEAIDTLYGWRQEDGTKLRFSSLRLYIAKQNGKSYFSAVLLAVTAVAKKGSHSVLIASTKKQAEHVWRHFVSLCKPTNKKHVFLLGKTEVWLRASKERIEFSNGSLIEIYSQSPAGAGGGQLDLLICDEFWAWPSHSARDLWAQVKFNVMAKSGLVVTLTTAQFDTSHLAYEELLRCRSILQAKNDDWTTLPLVYELPEDKLDQWQDESTWQLANPAWGKIAPLSFYRQEFAKTKDNAYEEHCFKTLLLNIPCGSSSQWLSPIFWAQCAHTKPESDFYGSEAVIGIDYARRYDLCAYSVIVEKDGLFWVWPRFFIPADCADQKEHDDKVPYRAWAKTSQITFTPGNVVDTSYLRARIKDDCRNFRICHVLFDPTGLEESRQMMMADGLLCTEVNQHVTTMSPAFFKLEELIKTKKLRHPSCKVLDWNFNNCTVKPAEDKLIVTKASEAQRIDGIDSIAIGLTHWLQKKETLPVLPEGQKWVMGL